MVKRRTVDLLPEIFRTETNHQFLSATLDQLTQEPVLKKTQGYVGRRVGPGVNPADNYVVEPTETRSDYQLEPGVVFFRPGTTRVDDAITYPGMIDALALKGANIEKQDRLFQSEYYAWDPFCDLDKFVNYSQYYWLPGGPDSVDVGTTVVPITDDFEVSRTNLGYRFTGVAGNNPVLTLVRGGSYQFIVNQPGNQFWIQSAPGIAGTVPGSPNISSRQVLGVDNNGTTQGVVTFNVPQKDAQDFFYNLADAGEVDLLTTTVKFNEINNVYLGDPENPAPGTFFAQYPNGIDGITNLDGRTIIFTNNIQDPVDGGWQITTQFDPLRELPSNNGLEGSYDTTLFDETTDIVDQADRYAIYRINYRSDLAGNTYMTLTQVMQVPNLSRIRILFGSQWSNTQWYKTVLGFWQQVPLLTAVLDTLWYQDSNNPELFGRIRLVDAEQTQPLDINEIIGARDYTSPNGVVFTNGLKVQFRGPTVPAEYQDLEFYVEGVGTGPGIDFRAGFVDGEAYFGPWHIWNNQRMTGSQHREDVFQQFIYHTIEESLENYGAGAPAGAPLPTEPVPLFSIANGIRLVPVRSLVTPETYTRSATIPYDSTSYDSTPYDAALNEPEVPDYLTINRSSRDLNAWSRSNRWFHVDVIRYSAERNNQIAIIDNNRRAKRPIIEFRSNLELWNFGTQGKQPVNIIDFSETDAFSNINGKLGYGIDGYSFINGTRVIFARDRDLQVRNQIYEVQFIDPDGNPNSPQIINLVPAAGGETSLNQTVVVLSGNTEQGVSYWFDGIDWQRAQQKTTVNQAPLFNVRDINGRSFGDLSAYPSSDFKGSRLFGYAEGGTQITDEVLGLSLKFLNIQNVGDILFENYFYTDEFLYVRNSVSQTEPISQGFVRQYLDRTQFTRLIGWQTAAEENRSRQVFRFVYDGSPLILDIPIDQSSVFAPIQLYQGTEFLDPTRYVYIVDGDATVITLIDPPELGTVIEVQAISNQASTAGFYQVPLNLESNPLNENSAAFTLGTIRTHYQSIGQNLRNLQGPIDGANNTRDLGDILRFGNTIVQHSSPLALTGTFLRQRQYEVISAIEFNSREYQKYKAQLIDAASRGDYVNLTATEILDDAIQEIALGRTDVSPFYWTDMLPAGENYTELQYTFTDISSNVFDTRLTYDYTSSNFQGMLVYLNGRILTRGYDYTVGPDAPIITILIDLVIGDQIVIREFETTYANFVPNTPTKMGLYPAYRPEIFLDNSYVDPVPVIRGHDGSITVAYGDLRDQVLLEFETRIFNNIKITSKIPLTAVEVIPGQWRETDYSLQEINEILSTDFLGWVGWNKLDYANQIYLSNDAFTFNYSQSSNKINRQPLLGAWRGIYLNLYDTTAPNTRPWEMLGFSERPDWWEDIYGPAPYTSGNLVLWDDLAQGIVRDPAGEYVLPQYRRPDLESVIPVGSEGELLPPLDVVVSNFDPTSFRRSWTFGDDGPTENAWRTSSAWPFAVMRLLALTKPAKFFGLFADRDRYVFNDSLAQYVWDGRYRLDAKQLDPIYGDGTSKASYINWIIDYNRQLGSNSTEKLTNTFKNIGVRLCWRMASFSDKNFLKVFTERSTPNSLNASLLLPDESYSLLLYKNQPFEQISYSSVIIQRVETGYQVLGYSQVKPYFEILTSQANGQTTVIEVSGKSVRVALEHSDNVVQVPYGYVFTNVTAVCDFLVSYGRLLERRGFVFESQENGYVLDWLQMASEFLYWNNQGWAPGSLINLNPGAVRMSVTRPGAVVESLATLRPENLILNQNRQPFPSKELVIERLDNTFRITSLTANTINYLNLEFTSYEHLMVLDNSSIFADLIYDPVTGARQTRVLVSGYLSGDWNGTVNAPGFVLNEDNIAEWLPSKQYSKGEIVLFKGEYWTATKIIQPSTEFDYQVWLRTDYDLIQKGLLSNAANSSDQLAGAYSVYDANLEQEVDLFSYGLIGFRPRDYMQALNLDDVSQVGVYQQFLGSKGTRRSAELFTFADLGKESAEYDIYEYWSMLRSSYGATANRNYFEILLDAAQLKSDPSLVEIVQPQQTSQADQTVQLKNLWKTSQPLNSTDVLPTRVIPTSETVLPSAGYVNFNDVEFTAFTLPDLASPAIAELSIGDNIWVAKSNSYDWNVYRTTLVPGDIVAISDNLDGRSLVTFTKQHGLQVGNWIIIRFFDTQIDGAYQVRAVPNLDTVLIDLVFLGTQTEITGTGVAFTIESARVRQAADIANLSYARRLTAGARAWVDDDGTGRWTVLEKTDPFQTAQDLVADQPVNDSGFGKSLTQGLQNLACLIGAPGESAGGAVYAFVKNDQDQYQQSARLSLSGTTAVGEFGSAMDSGNQTWAVVGAPGSLSGSGYATVIFNSPGSNAFVINQLLLDASGNVNDEFGHSVTISQNERWIYVGAPGANKVYAYARVDVDNQTVSYTTDGTTTNYNYSNFIVIDPTKPDQLQIFLSSVKLSYPADYNIVGGNVVLSVPPIEGQPLIISRNNGILTVGDGSTAVYSLDNLYTVTDIYSFSIYVDEVIQVPGVDYVFDNNLRELTFDPVKVPGVGKAIRIVAGSYFKLVDVIDASTNIPDVISATARFGASVSTTTDGATVIVGAPEQEIFGQPAGAVYTFDRRVQRFSVTNSSTTSYTTVDALSPATGPTNVQVNGIYLTNTYGGINNQFTISSPSTVVISSSLQVGDIIDVDVNTFAYTQTIKDIDYFATAEFGFVVDQCVNDCSLYISAPKFGGTLPEAGHVLFWQNQSRVYGSITTPQPNRVLTELDWIRVNDYFVQIPAIANWNGALSYNTNSLVKDSGSIYLSLTPVPAGTALTDVEKWRAISWETVLAQAINSINGGVGVPNARATVSDDLVLQASGEQLRFIVGTKFASTDTLVYVDNVLQVLSVDYTISGETIVFAVPPSSQSEIRLISAKITVFVLNPDTAAVLDKVSVLPGPNGANKSPGDPTMFEELGFETYAYSQTIESPRPQDYSRFGSSLFISDSTVDLVVGAPDATAFEITTFDDGTTVFDAESTEFFDAVGRSGVAYTYDFLPAASPSVNNPGKFVFGQQIYDSSLDTGDQFGASVDYTTGTLLVGVPGQENASATIDTGRVAQLRNATRSPAWKAIRQQQPVVDVELLNSIFMYDLGTGAARQYFDYIDPLQGKILGAARQNIDYITPTDPAAYNSGELNNYGQRWAQEHVGEIWWDIRNARFIDPNQNDIVYASRLWSQMFPGSTVDVYQWISSSVPPAQYPGPGTPKSTTNFVVTSEVNEQGIFGTIYYFWVTGLRTVAKESGKTLSLESIARYIETPRVSGVAYIAAINSSTIALYNALPYITAQDSVIHVEYDQKSNDDVVHVEYQLIPQGRADGFLEGQLYRKFLDSFCGVDTVGNLVPDPFLSPSERYGVAFRPRQSFFANRFMALENYLTEANRVMSKFPIAEIRSFPLLQSQDPEPPISSGLWNQRVLDDAELSYQNLALVPVGYRYLVATDANNNGRWAIYEVIAGEIPGSKSLVLMQVQNYDTRLYWSYQDWYLEGYNPLTRISAEVPSVSALDTITVNNGASVKVTANSQGKFEIYLRDNERWVRVGVQNGTIQISPEIWNYSLGRFGFDVEVFDAQYFDQEPVTETRRIIQSLNQEILIDDLAVERNRLLVLMFNYILSEQVAPTWLTKTSLIDVDHVVRRLEPFQVYRQDNQDFVLNYIQEVKPYHTQIRNFNLIYQGSDVYDGTVTDFDVPAYWDAAQLRFISPVLDNTGVLSTTSSTPSDSLIWQTLPWSQWYQNYLLSIEAVDVIQPGSGYLVPPEVKVTGECERPATMIAQVNSAGQVSRINVIDPGAGYSTTAIIELIGGLPEATPWQPQSLIFSGSVIQTPVGDVYTVNSSGVSGQVPPTEKSNSVVNGTLLLTYIGTRARAVARMGNELVRSFVTTLRYDRYQYSSDIVAWQTGTVYTAGELVRYDDRVWRAIGTPNTTIFDLNDWQLVPAGDLSGVDRTMGYYDPAVNQPGLDLALLISGVDYPGVQVDAPDFNQNTGFDVGNYDINPFDNISFGPEGRPTYDPAILDAIYESEFDDPFLGTLPAPAYNGEPVDTRPGAIEVNGGGFVDTYSSHAPEELVPGAIFDTLDIRVFSTPGADWLGDGHGFSIASRRYISSSETLYFGNLLEFTATIRVWNATLGTQLIPGTQYVVDWQNFTVTILSGVAAGNVVNITAYGVGGGNQMYRQKYNGEDVGNEILIPLQSSLVEGMVIFVNGAPITNYTYSADSAYVTRINFDDSYSSADYILVTVLGPSTNGNYSWSAPITQYAVYQGGPLVFELDNSLQGTNPANIIVEVGGRRARPAAGQEYIGDGSTVVFDLPNRGGYSPGSVAENEVAVYVNNLKLSLGIDYVVDPWDGSSDRTVTLATAPSAGSNVLISVDTNTDYFFSGNTVIWRSTASLVPILGDVVSFTTWNDTAEQNIVTRVFVGPTEQGVQISQGYDITDYDVGNVSGEPGSFDYAVGTLIKVNRFDVGRPIANTDRVLVSVNGLYKFSGLDFIEERDFDIEGTEIVFPGTVIENNAVVVITVFTNSVVPGSVAFRIFQDMRGAQSAYRILEATSTILQEDISSVSDVIKVKDASRLPTPNMPLGIFGQITINGERITYREKDDANNTLLGLRRGVFGTAAANHLAGSPIYSISSGNLLPLDYQNQLLTSNTIADGSTTIFVAENIDVAGIDSTEMIESVEVYVGGLQPTTNFNGDGETTVFVLPTAPTNYTVLINGDVPTISYSVNGNQLVFSVAPEPGDLVEVRGYSINSANPVTIEFDAPPIAGYQVTIQIRRGQWWYDVSTPEQRNKSLQENAGDAARFIRGQ